MSLRSKYKFELASGKAYRFQREKIWKGVFACENGEESFRLYRHKGLNYSIFSNDVQIAAFSKNRVEISGGERYEILMNDNADPIVVICMVLAIDSLEKEGSDPLFITVHFGNLGPEERPFDASWRPS